MTTIRVGGVPEHFNLPWHLAIENKKFANANLDIRWTDYPGGTGAMCQDLREDELDVAIVLTEGIVTDINKGNDAKIVQFYVESPLVWGIHTAADSKVKTIDDLEGGVYAISRYGSGSHLMAFVDAKNRGWSTQDLQFELVQNLDGARKSLLNMESDGFMWEKFTTKPLVDCGDFRRIGECPTPWPCFSIAVSNRFLKQYPEAIENMLSVINTAAKEVQSNPDIVPVFADRYGLKLDDVRSWFASTTWTTKKGLDIKTLESVQATLLELGIIEQVMDVKQMIHG